MVLLQMLDFQHIQASPNIAQTRMNRGFAIKQFEHRVFDCCYLQQIPFFAGAAQSQTTGFRLMDTTIEEVHDAYKSHRLAVRQLVQLYLNRIEAYDKKGPGINSIITINPRALKDADELDAAFKASGLTGPLHGIPVIIKDQMDARGMPTTLGSILFKNYFPDQDSFVAEKLRKAGAIIMAKTTLGELGGGDTYGSLFGSTRNHMEQCFSENSPMPRCACFGISVPVG